MFWTEIRQYDPWGSFPGWTPEETKRVCTGLDSQKVHQWTKVEKERGTFRTLSDPHTRNRKESKSYYMNRQFWGLNTEKQTNEKDPFFTENLNLHDSSNTYCRHRRPGITTPPSPYHRFSPYVRLLYLFSFPSTLVPSRFLVLTVEVS